ncbi:hypothetical protein [Xanthovirga aplysinae]|uniref:hypothetical protein n=1 Tax=Xanthovirga aplysinae TaxID=2529853 RepID=UPI0012BBFCB0|nr:hypothetical protein [Xanthovirga aplysinae]
MKYFIDEKRAEKELATQESQKAYIINLITWGDVMLLILLVADSSKANILDQEPVN